MSRRGGGGVTGEESEAAFVSRSFEREVHRPTDGASDLATEVVMERATDAGSDDAAPVGMFSTATREPKILLSSSCRTSASSGLSATSLSAASASVASSGASTAG
jgi:hypothetical protein